MILVSSCGAYLALRNHLRFDDEKEQTNFSDPATKMFATTTFFVLLVISLFSLELTVYGRTWAFFVLMSLMTGVAVFGIMSFDLSKGTRNLLLGQIFSIFLVLRLSLFQQFPSSVLGGDPLRHMSTMLEIAMLGKTIPGSYYAGFPGMYFASLILSEFTALDIRSSYILALTAFELVGYLFIFLLTKHLTNTRVALLSTLMLSILQTTIRWGWWLTPTTIGLSLLPLLVYCLLQNNRNSNLQYKIILMFLLSFVIITHTFSTFVFFVIMLLMYVALRWLGLMKRAEHKREAISPLILKDHALIFIFALAFLSYWSFAASQSPYQQSFIQEVALSLEFGFRINIRTLYVPPLTFPEWVAARAGAASFESLAIFGCLFMISTRHGSLNRFLLSVAALSLTALTFGLQALNLSELLPLRWLPFADYLTVAAAALALYLTALFIRRFGLRRFILIIMVSSIAFANVMAPEASFDSPFATPQNSYRYALLASEMEGANFLSHAYNGPVLTDEYFRYDGPLYNLQAVGLTPQQVSSHSFNNAGLLIFRKYDVSTGLIVFTSSAEGTMQLPPDYENTLSSNAQLNKIYSSNTLSAFLPSSQENS